MPSTTTIPEVRAALVELIAEAVDLLPAAVTYGETSNPMAERVVVGDTSGTEGERNWALLGAATRARDERYAVSVTVTVMVPGYSQQRATERAYELWGQIEQAHIEAPTLGVPGVIVTALDQPVDFDILNDDEGFGCQIVSSLMVQARITRST